MGKNHEGASMSAPPREIWISPDGLATRRRTGKPMHAYLTKIADPDIRYVLASVPTARERLLAGALLGHTQVVEALAEANAILSAPEPTDEI